MSGFQFNRREVLKTAGIGVLGSATLSATATASSAISYNETISGELSEESAFDEDYNGYHEMYTFAGEAGDVISIEMRPDTAAGAADENHAPRLELYGPENDQIETASTTFTPHYGAVSLSGVELEANGTYTLIVTTAYYSNAEPYSEDADTYYDTFAYELRLHEFYGAPTELSYNTTTTDVLGENSNFIRNKNGYCETYSFEGTRGDIVSIEMRPDTPAGAADEAHAPRLELYGPENERIETASTTSTPHYGAVSLSGVELETDGTYTLVVTTAYYSNADRYSSYSDTYFDSFAYELRLHEFYGAPTELSYNTTTTGELDKHSNFLRNKNGYYDVYGFTGAKGDVLDISMLAAGDPTTEAHTPRLELYGPENDQIETASTTSTPHYGAVSMSGVELEADGTYTLVATTAYYSNADPYSNYTDTYFDRFAYTLQLYEPDGGVETELSPTETFTGQLTADDLYMHEYVGYHDRYAVTGREGETISAEMRVPIPDDQAAQLQLRTPTGDIVETARVDAGNAQLDRVEFEADGQYTLVVTTTEDFTADVYDSRIDARADTFQYELRVYEFVGDRDLLTDGDTVQSVLEPDDNFQESFVGFYDAYRTTAMADDTISVEMNIDQPDDNAAKIIVLGPDGSTATSTTVSSGHAAIETEMLPETGEYTIIATSEHHYTSTVYDTQDAAEHASFQYQLSFTGPANAPPLIDEIGAEPRRAAIGEAVNLTVDAFDPDGGALEYEWDQVMGAFPDPEVDIAEADTATATFQAPDVEAENELTFTVTVADGDAGVVSEDVNLRVDPDLEPDADPTAAFTVTPTTPTVGHEVTFDASSAFAPDGELTDYSWSVEGPESVTVTGETTTQTFETAGEYDVQLTVTTETGLTDTATADLVIAAQPGGVGDYANEDGVVETDGLRSAIDDWRGGNIDTAMLREVVDAWRSGEAIV